LENAQKILNIFQKFTKIFKKCPYNFKKCQKILKIFGHISKCKKSPKFFENFGIFQKNLNIYFEKRPTILKKISKIFEKHFKNF
jgi:hypothetical protein